MKIIDIIKESIITERTLAGFKVTPIAKINPVDEAIHLNPPHTRLAHDEISDYVTRIKTNTKTNKDIRTKPIIHASNVNIVDEHNKQWDLNDLAQQIMARPNVKSVITSNSKMKKSSDELARNNKMKKSVTLNEVIFDITLPALAGIVVDEETMEFVEVNTCPGAGDCKIFCYARKGGYRMFKHSSMAAARYLNFLLNDPQGFANMVNNQIKNTKSRLDKSHTKLVVRWHDAGDFFSKEYLNLAYNIAKQNPDVEFYAYTKMAMAVTNDSPPNWLNRFSTGSTTHQAQQVHDYEKQGNTVLKAQVVPQQLFIDLIAKNDGKKVKDESGQLQFQNNHAVKTFIDRLAKNYNIDPKTVISYNSIISKPIGKSPKWNVIVPPGAGDLAAKRKDVLNTFLLFH